jgi:hypothetical protein
MVKNHQNCNKWIAMEKASAADGTFEVNGQYSISWTVTDIWHGMKKSSLHTY